MEVHVRIVLDVKQLDWLARTTSFTPAPFTRNTIFPKGMDSTVQQNGFNSLSRAAAVYKN